MNFIKVLVSEYGHEMSQSHTADQPAERLRYRAPTALLSHAFFKKKQRRYCYRVRPSVRLYVCQLCYFLFNRWTKFNQIWCVSDSHIWGVQRQFLFGPATWGPGEGSKGQISFNFNYKVNLYQTLCVFSQMKDTKHIRRDFNSVA